MFSILTFAKYFIKTSVEREREREREKKEFKLTVFSLYFHFFKKNTSMYSYFTDKRSPFLDQPYCLTTRPSPMYL